MRFFAPSRALWTAWRHPLQPAALPFPMTRARSPSALSKVRRSTMVNPSRPLASSGRGSVWSSRCPTIRMRIGHTRRMVARALVAAGDPCFPPSMGMMPCLAAGPRNWSVYAVLTTSRLPCRLPSRMQPSPRLSRIQLSVLFPRVRRTIPLCFRNSPWAMDRSC